jgi:PAS domain S-box-containing protein
VIKKKSTSKKPVQKVKKSKKETLRSQRTKGTIWESEEMWRSVVDGAPNFIMIVDRKGTIQYINHTVPGLEVEETVGRSHYDYADPAYHKVMKKAITHVFRTGTATKYEVGGVGPNGSISWYMTQLGPIRHKGAVVGVIVMPTDITKQKQAEEKLKSSEEALQVRRNQLEDVNRALRVLIKQRDLDRTEVEEKVMANVKELVLPYVEKLRKNSSDMKQMAYLNILESNLRDIVAPFAHKLSAKYSRLTPTEIQTAQLIKDGRTSREIAKLLHVSTRTIESHRQNIRMKMGLHAKKANLRSYLLSM